MPATKPRALSPKPSCAGGVKLDGVFVLSHDRLELGVDETQEITLYAFPLQVRHPTLAQTLTWKRVKRVFWAAKEP